MAAPLWIAATCRRLRPGDISPSTAKASQPTTQLTSLNAADCRVARPPLEDFVNELQRRDLARNIVVAAQLLAGWGLTETRLAPVRQ